VRFSYNIVAQKLKAEMFGFETFCRKDIGEKCTSKMLMKLTPDPQNINFVKILGCGQDFITLPETISCQQPTLTAPRSTLVMSKWIFFQITFLDRKQKTISFDFWPLFVQPTDTKGIWMQL
jgi:hypothetical protein